MKPSIRLNTFWAFTLAVAMAALPAAAQTASAGDYSSQSLALAARYTALKTELEENPFHRPLHMESSEGADNVRGEVFALVNYPMAAAAAALHRPAQWCDLLILHLNTKYCRPSEDGTMLRVNIGRKFNQTLEQAYRFDFSYHLVADTPGYLQVTLDADQGPLSTSNYRIVLEAVPVENGRTFLRFAYSYSFGTLGRLAMQVYLATTGSGKVGFTVAGTERDNAPVYIGGTRGVVERNTMRYYLAVEAHLATLGLPARERMEQSLRDWFASIEHYPRQLHEMERDDYLAMKHLEVSRQQATARIGG